MKEIVFDSFKSTLQELQLLNDIIKNEKGSKEDIQNGLIKARDLLFSSYSNLNIFDEVVRNYVSIGHKITSFNKKPKKKLTKIEVKVIYSQLVELIKKELQPGILNPKESLIIEDQYYSLGLNFYIVSLTESIIQFNENLNINVLSRNELFDALNKYFEEIISYIRELLLYNIFMIFDKPNITYLNKITIDRDYKKEYIDKWVNCSVEFSDLLRNKRIDYWGEICDLNLDYAHIERIEKHQEKIFNKTVDIQVSNVFSDIEELNENKQVEQIEKELALINGFFKGDLSKLTIKRLKEIIEFSKPKKLILAYDELKKSNYYSAMEYLIYDYKYIRRYTNYFVASFFIKYIKTLEEYKDNSVDSFSPNQTDPLLLEKETDSFKTFVNQEKQDYILKILEDLAITKDGVYNLGDRSKGTVRGVIEALREEHIIPKLSLKRLCDIIANQINLELKSKLDWSNTSEDYHKKAKQYIKDNPLH